MGLRTENSFRVHLPMTLLVVGVGGWLRLDAIRFAILVVCISSVWGAELLNASIERLARAVDQAENSQLKDALDLASGAVLAVSIGAAIVGTIILVPPLLRPVLHLGQ